MTGDVTAEGLDPRRLPPTVLPGVGPARAARLERLGIASVHDLLVLAPVRIERRHGNVPVDRIGEHMGEEVQVRVRLGAPRIFRRGRRNTVTTTARDATGSLSLHWFNQPWRLESLRELARSGEDVELQGKVVLSQGRPTLAGAKVQGSTELPAGESFAPVFATTEGISQDLLRGLTRLAFELHGEALEETLDGEESRRLAVPSLRTAVADLHQLESEERLGAALRRLSLERLLRLQARLAELHERLGGGQARAFARAAGRERALVDALPHRLTAGQARVLDEIRRDLAHRRPMRRLLQGEVGSGKTLVALAALATVARGGGQGALLAPTELLAEQHAVGLAPVLERLGVRAVLLTGSLPVAERRARLAEVARGEAAVVIGTHRLFSKDVEYRRLDLVVVDEQQRFGVAQKQSLVDKGRDVHLLLMTATPIPRTLALCLYGDLEQSLLDERPPGRGEVTTRVVDPKNRGRALGHLDNLLAAGERGFWVCPRIEADDDGDEGPAAAEVAYGHLRRSSLGRHGVVLVHGRLDGEERARRIESFRRGESRLLVGTTVVEVGVDVPEATFMVVEDAERFGLAQLHQLRGRVGRGGRPGLCLFLVKKGAEEDLAFLAETNDGFAIAEEDLRRRGMGDLGGLRQAGAGGEGWGDPGLDLDLVRWARQAVSSRPDLRRTYLRGPASGPALV